MNRKEVLDLARSQLGTVESPPNSNNQKYGIWYGFNRQPWCAMFLSWVFAHKSLGHLFRFASVSAAVADARQRGRISRTFKMGDVACMLTDGLWSPGHVGIVEAVHSDGTVTTIEGNTSPGAAGSQRDGGGVYRRRRSKSFWNAGCIAIDYPVQPQGGDDEMKPRVVRNSATGECFVWNGTFLVRANEEDHRNIVRFYAGQTEPWDNWDPKFIAAVPIMDIPGAN